MNSVALAQRLARHLDVDDRSLLSADEGLDVLQAINAAMQTFFALAPAHFKRQTISTTLKAPQQQNVTFAAQYSNQLAGGSSFDASMLQCTALLGDGSYNVITGTGSVLDNWLLSALATTATVYSDVALVDQPIERIVGEISLSQGVLSTYPKQDYLIRNERLKYNRWWQFESCPGRPRWYWMDYLTVSRGMAPAAVLRVAPAPDVDINIRFDAELSPITLTFASLTNAVAVPIPDNHVESIFLPLCEAELTLSRYWKEAKLIRLTLDKAEAVKKERLNRIPNDVGAPNNYCGVAFGY